MERAKPRTTTATATRSKINDSSVLFKLIRLVNLAARPFEEQVGKQHLLSLNEWRVMLVLDSHPGCTATAVVDYSGLDKMSVSRALANLVKAARVQRVVDKEDARRALVRLTVKGKALFDVIADTAAQRERAVFASLTPTEVAKLSLTVDKLISVLLEKSE
jgi:DNA-binding MarR family transcriptional regulator